jgi:hypothetical protein
MEAPRPTLKGDLGWIDYIYLFIYLSIYMFCLLTYIYIHIHDASTKRTHIYIYTYIAYNNITKVAMPSLISRDIYMYMHIKKPSLQVAISHI